MKKAYIIAILALIVSCFGNVGCVESSSDEKSLPKPPEENASPLIKIKYELAKACYDEGHYCAGDYNYKKKSIEHLVYHASDTFKERMKLLKAIEENMGIHLEIGNRKRFFDSDLEKAINKFIEDYEKEISRVAAEKRQREIVREVLQEYFGVQPDEINKSFVAEAQTNDSVLDDSSQSSEEEQLIKKLMQKKEKVLFGSDFCNLEFWNE